MKAFFQIIVLRSSILQSPVFTKQPGSIVYPVETLERNKEVVFSCEAQGSPPPSYRWKLNGTEISSKYGSHYILSGGNLRINRLNKDQDAGTYQCLASNSFGTIVSREASLTFAYLENFKTHRRSSVFVREGQGVVLLCGPPPHSGDLIFSWIFNEYPTFVKQDNRRFISQETGNLYIAKVEPSDVGNYTCVVTNMVTKTRVQGPPTPLVLRSDGVMGEYEPKIEVQFPEFVHVAKGSTVKLECFALGNPVPSINWRRVDGVPFSRKVDTRKASGVLEIPYFQQEDAGIYECMAENSRGMNTVKGKLSFYDAAPPQLIEKPQDVQKLIDDSLVWECKATGKPKPSYRWMKNGENLEPLEKRVQLINRDCSYSSLNIRSFGNFSCFNQKRQGNRYMGITRLSALPVMQIFAHISVLPRIFLSAEGRVKHSVCGRNKSPHFVWRCSNAAVQSRYRISILGNGNLRIWNATTSDAGLYTCIARNQFGMASSTGTLSVKDPTMITTLPSTLDVTVGESMVLPCQVSHDPSLELKFTWFFNEQLIHFGSHGGSFEKVGGQHSAGDIMIRNIQLRHAGKYTCAVQTKVDSISIALDLVVRGPPGPPTSIHVEEISDITASLSWRPGPDNHSPITAYAIQARTPFSLGWQAVTTVPDVVAGHQLRATVTELSPWVEYEFRVLASNAIGTGEPSKPSKQARTKGTSPKVTPANVSGGGGSRSELVITWEVSELEQVSFTRKEPSAIILCGTEWPNVWHFIFRNTKSLTLLRFSVLPARTKNRIMGVMERVAAGYSSSAEPGRAPTRIRAKSLSASEIEVWKALPWSVSKKRVLGYELRYWSRSEKEDMASVQRTVGNQTSTVIRGVKGSTAYYISVRAYNTAGTGPPSSTVNVTTKKPPPSQPPAKVMWNTSDSKIIINWERVKALENESEVTGYKVLYKKNRHSHPNVMETNTTSVELALPTDEDYIIQIKPFGEGGDGSSSKQITIPRIPGTNAVGSASKVSTLSALSTIALSFTARTSL
uniref:Contactin 4 n=1 Tax=Tetraodon nigroviridis TaxID=99883 RepID=H3CPG9_TETNG